ncbi:MAG TPA: hypothetical protein VF121_04215 [Thermoanaerobaculia bacterium]|nr:hypothetical protein [Thermoanaerobaculia bacterium]
MEEAPWRLGVVRLRPWIGLYDVQYVDNALGAADEEEEVSDLTATFGAGLRAYLRTGPKLVWAAHLLPEYVAWQDLEERRSVNGRYGLGAFGFFNRLTLEALAERDQQQRLASAEVPEQAHERRERGRLAAEVKATGRISVFGSAELARVRYEADDAAAPLERLDRDASYLRAGLRWHLPRGWSVGLGAERSQVDFEDPDADRSNAGTSPVAEVRWDRPERYLRLELARRSLEPRGGSSFVPFEEPTALLEAGFNSDGRMPVWVYGGRGLVYALSGDYAYFTDDRLGLSARLELGWRSDVQLFAERARHDYAAVRAGVAARRDDATAYGLGVGFALGRSTRLSLSARRLELASSLPGFDRSVASFGAGVALGGRRSEW